MEYFINELPLSYPGGDLVAKVLIATLYSPDPVLLASNRIGADRLILIVNKKADKSQKESLTLIMDSIGRVVDVKTIEISVYDIPAIAKKCVEVIDMQPKEDHVFVNITSGRKTMALGLLFAAYARCNRVERIAYNPEDDKSVVYLPKMSFKLNDSQRKILEYLADGGACEKSYAQIAEDIGLSRAMLYKTLDELKNLDFVSADDCLEITDAGRIAML